MQPATSPNQAETPATLSTEALIELQRHTIREHVRYEQSKQWPEVYGTFTPHEEQAYYDVVPFQARFARMKGVVDFYEAFTKGFPDFQIVIRTENAFDGVISAPWHR